MYDSNTYAREKLVCSCSVRRAAGGAARRRCNIIVSCEGSHFDSACWSCKIYCNCGTDKRVDRLIYRIIRDGGQCHFFGVVKEGEEEKEEEGKKEEDAEHKKDDDEEEEEKEEEEEESRSFSRSSVPFS